MLRPLAVQRGKRCVSQRQLRRRSISCGLGLVGLFDEKFDVVAEAVQPRLDGLGLGAQLIDATGRQRAAQTVAATKVTTAIRGSATQTGARSISDQNRIGTVTKP